MKFHEVFKSIEKADYVYFTNLEDDDGIFVAGKYPAKLKKRLKLNDDWLYYIRIWLSNKGDNLINISSGICVKKGESFSNPDESRSRPLSFPIDLESRNEFIFEPVGKITNKKGKEISASEIVKFAFESHIKATKPLKGFLLRTRLQTYRFLAWIYQVLYFLGIGFYYLLTGEKVIKSIEEHYWYDKIKKEEEIIISKKDKETVIFLGIKGNLNIIFIYSLIHLVLFFYCYSFSIYPKWAKYILNYNLLTLCYVATSLIFIGYFLPKAVWWGIKKITKKYSKYKYAVIEI